MNGSLPLVSVVIPVFNRSHLINRTLKSVQQQTYSNIEVIIVDDCSDDSEQLKGVIAQFKQLNISYIRHERNKHGGASRNTGIKASRGKYIVFLDSDDTWTSCKLEKCVSVLESSSADYVYTQLKQVKTGERKYPLKGLNEIEPVADYLLLNQGTIQTSSIVMKTNIALEHLFDESLKRFQDYDFVINLDLNNIRPMFIPEVMVIMHDEHGNRISSSYNPEPAKFWARKIKGVISRDAYQAFYYNRLVRYTILNGEALKAIRLIFSGQGNLYLKCKWFLIVLTPLWLIRFIKSLITNR
jgi:glycosyltransferase involved in cell wall biosynthesis